MKISVNTYFTRAIPAVAGMAKLFITLGAVEIPKGEKIQVHENTSKIVHLVIPRKPTGELSIKELESTAAAFTGSADFSFGGG